MYFKMAFSNVKKSMKDFTIYFLTLTLGVCLFYVFNSVESQKALMTLTDNQSEVMGMMEQIISYLSIFISFILGFLILYANSFLIKRRKKELGLYLLLGMEKNHVSRILLIETVFIGVFSLLTGLLVGIAASQGMSVITAKLFVVEMEEFRFVFSFVAFLKTVIYFSIIYLIVTIFNHASVSKYTIIDMLSANKKIEKRRITNLWFSVILFIISVGCLGYAYHLIRENGLMMIDGQFTRSLLLGVVGTFMFFYSLSGLLIKIVKASKNLYFRGLNMFVLRQINAKITTTFVSMSMICLLLFLSITVLSAGMGAARTMSDNLISMTPYDASFTANVSQMDPAEADAVADSSYGEWLIAQFKANGIPHTDKITTAATYTLYNLDGVYGDGLYAYVDQNRNVPDVTTQTLHEGKVDFVKLSDYNKMMELQNLPLLELAPDEAAISSQMNQMIETFELLINKDGKLSIQDKDYTLKTKVETTIIETTTFTINWGFVIVPDEVLTDGVPVSYTANLRYDMARDMEQEWTTAINNTDQYLSALYITRTEAYEQQSGLAAICAYLAIYLGLIFLISCSAIIALQQLSESSDNIERYKLLRKLGTDEKDIQKSLFAQTCITFFVPLSLALVHSFIAIPILNNVIKVIGLDASSGITAAIAGILIVYGGYMLVTYYASKGMHRELRR